MIDKYKYSLCRYVDKDLNPQQVKTLSQLATIGRTSWIKMQLTEDMKGRIKYEAGLALKEVYLYKRMFHGLAGLAKNEDMHPKVREMARREVEIMVETTHHRKR